MFTVVHNSEIKASIHETEADAIKQLHCFYGPTLFIDEKDRAAGRLRVWRSESASENEFAAPIAKIVLPKEEAPEDAPVPKVAPKTGKH